MAQTVVIDALDELPLLSPLDILSHLNDRRARRLRSDEWSSRLLQRVDDRWRQQKRHEERAGRLHLGRFDTDLPTLVAAGCRAQLRICIITAPGRALLWRVVRCHNRRFRDPKKPPQKKNPPKWCKTPFFLGIFTPPGGLHPPRFSRGPTKIHLPRHVATQRRGDRQCASILVPGLKCSFGGQGVQYEYYRCGRDVPPHHPRQVRPRPAGGVHREEEAARGCWRVREEDVAGEGQRRCRSRHFPFGH